MHGVRLTWMELASGIQTIPQTTLTSTQMNPWTACGSYCDISLLASCSKCLRRYGERLADYMSVPLVTGCLLAW